VAVTANDLDETLATIERRAKGLRDAGVIGRVTIGDITFELDALEPAPLMPLQQSAPQEKDPLDDGDTFGTGAVPKRRKPLSHDAARAEFEED
jgi:hypothetical protein